MIIIIMFFITPGTTFPGVLKIESAYRMTLTPWHLHFPKRYHGKQWHSSVVEQLRYAGIKNAVSWGSPDIREALFPSTERNSRPSSLMGPRVSMATGQKSWEGWRSSYFLIFSNARLSNRLCLNLDKTKYLWFGTRQQLGKCDTVALSNTILAAMVSDTVTRNLGLLLDQEQSMGDHITKLSQVCFFHLRRIRVVRHSLTRNALLTLVHAFVCSRLDFCNSAMFGVHSYLLDRLQSILNAAAWLILQIHKFSSISSAIRDELHWLPADPGLFSNGASLSEAVWPAQLHPISLSFVSQSLQLLVVVKICARLPEVPLWYQGSGQNDTVGGVSPFRALTYNGTRCRQEFALSSKSQISSRENLNIIKCSNNHIALLRSFSLGALYKCSLLLLLLQRRRFRSCSCHQWRSCQMGVCQRVWNRHVPCHALPSSTRNKSNPVRTFIVVI